MRFISGILILIFGNFLSCSHSYAEDPIPFGLNKARTLLEAGKPFESLLEILIYQREQKKDLASLYLLGVANVELNNVENAVSLFKQCSFEVQSSHGESSYRCLTALLGTHVLRRDYFSALVTISELRRTKLSEGEQAGLDLVELIILHAKRDYLRGYALCKDAMTKRKPKPYTKEYCNLFFEIPVKDNTEQVSLAPRFISSWNKLKKEGFESTDSIIAALWNRYDPTDSIPYPEGIIFDESVFKDAIGRLFNIVDTAIREDFIAYVESRRMEMEILKRNLPTPVELRLVSVVRRSEEARMAYLEIEINNPIWLKALEVSVKHDERTLSQLYTAGSLFPHMIPSTNALHIWVPLLLETGKSQITLQPVMIGDIQARTVQQALERIASIPKVHVLVVGVDNYNANDISTPKKVSNEALRLAQTFGAFRENITIELLINQYATKDAVRRWFEKHPDPSAIRIVVLRGLETIVREDQDRKHAEWGFIPVDGGPKTKNSLISTSDIITWNNEHPAKGTLFLIDTDTLFSRELHFSPLELLVQPKVEFPSVACNAPIGFLYSHFPFRADSLRLYEGGTSLFSVAVMESITATYNTENNGMISISSIISYIRSYVDRDDVRQALMLNQSRKVHSVTCGDVSWHRDAISSQEWLLNLYRAIEALPADRKLALAPISNKIVRGLMQLPRSEWWLRHIELLDILYQRHHDITSAINAWHDSQ